MSRPTTYSNEVIEKAKEMYSNKISAQVIADELGFTSRFAVLWYVNPKYKAIRTKYTIAWQKKNPERNKQIVYKAVKKYMQSDKGKINARNSSKIRWQKVLNDPELHQREIIRARKNRLARKALLNK